MAIVVSSVAARILVSAIVAKKPKAKGKIVLAELKFACAAAKLTTSRFSDAVTELKESGYVSVSKDALSLTIEPKFVDELKKD